MKPSMPRSFRWRPGPGLFKIAHFRKGAWGKARNIVLINVGSPKVESAMFGQLSLSTPGALSSRFLSRCPVEEVGTMGEHSSRSQIFFLQLT